MKTTKILLFAAILALMPLLLIAQIDEKTMQGDITILEDVLDDLLSPPGSPQQFSCRGLYLDGYGVIFHVNHGGADQFPFIKDLKVNMKLNWESQFYEGRSDSLPAKKGREIVAGIKKNLGLFYADYARGLSQLPTSERITILVNFENSPVLSEWNEKDEKTGLQDFYVSVSKSELPAMRQGRNPESMLHFQDAKTNAAVDRELEIFTRILSKTVGGQAERAPWMGSGARNMVVPGYGTIILLTFSFFDLANREALKEYAAQAAAQAEKKPGLSIGFSSPEESWKKKSPVLKEQIIEQLARYGGSLRSLKPDENIMIVLSSRHDFWGQERTPGVSIAARMADVNKVFNDEMNLQLFKNKLTIREY